MMTVAAVVAARPVVAAAVDTEAVARSVAVEECPVQLAAGVQPVATSVLVATQAQGWSPVFEMATLVGWLEQPMDWPELESGPELELAAEYLDCRLTHAPCVKPSLPLDYFQPYRVAG